MAEASAIVVLASSEVLPEDLGVEIGLDGSRRGRVAGASDGDDFPATQRDLSGEPFGEEEIGAIRKAAEMESDRHGREREREGKARGERETGGIGTRGVRFIYRPTMCLCSMNISCFYIIIVYYVFFSILEACRFMERIGFMGRRFDSERHWLTCQITEKAR